MDTHTIDIGGDVIQRFVSFPSRHTSARNVDVWTPPGYVEGLSRRYPVLYMHDGQHALDPATAKHGITWGVREAVTRLINDGAIPGCIVVGVWNSAQRRSDYMPQGLFEGPDAESARQLIAARFQTAFLEGAPASDGYLRFLVEELKPAIDARFRTLPDQPNTFVMGSSMGGLISLYAIAQYPETFFGAGCLSTHWIAGENQLVDYLGARLPAPAKHRLYFDFGTITLDAAYEPFQIRMDGWLERAGYVRGQSWTTLKFDGAAHTEAAWRARVELPLGFLFSQKG
jgi:predicted alpha/beta superfamily hydrolase